MRQVDKAVVGYLDHLAARLRRPPAASDLTRSSLGTYYDWMVTREAEAPNRRRECSPLTATQRVRIIERAWAWLHDHEEWGDRVPRPRRLDLPSPSPRLAPYAPTWADMDGCIAHARGWLGWLLTVLRCTGLRPGQVLRLEWADLDVGRGLLTIRPELGKTGRERRGRIIPVAPVLVAAAAGRGRREGLLVPGPPAREIRLHDVREAWTAAGIPRDRWRQPVYAFRRGFVSGLQAAGVAQTVVSRLVGHSLGVTGDIYTDPGAVMEAMRAAVAFVPAVGSVVDLDARRAGSHG